VAIQAAGDSGRNGLAAPVPALVVKNREDELTNARMKSTSSKLLVAKSATGWPGLLGLAAQKHVSAASELDPDSTLAVPRLFSLIQPSRLLEKSRPKLAAMSVLTVSGLAGPDALRLAAVESPHETDTTNATAPPTLRPLSATTSAAQPGISGPSGLPAPFLADEVSRTAVGTMSALQLLVKRNPELATLNFPTILTANGRNGLPAQNRAEAVLARDLLSTFATLPASSTLKLAAIPASGWNGLPGLAAR